MNVAAVTGVNFEYESRQVQRALRDEQRPAGEAAAAYGEDVRRMIAHRPEFWEHAGMIRLYTRIAVRLARVSLEPSA